MTALNLNIVNPTSRGRRALPLDAEVVREMDEADMELLTKPGEAAASPLKRLTDRHHTLARLLASGTPESEAAAIAGYSNSRVSILKADPAFQELMQLYRTEVDYQFSTTLEHMAGLTRDALLELRDRMEEEPEKFSNAELRALAETFYDRSKDDPDDSALAKLPEVIELVAPQPAVSSDRDAEGTE